MFTFPNIPERVKNTDWGKLTGMYEKNIKSTVKRSNTVDKLKTHLEKYACRRDEKGYHFWTLVCLNSSKTMAIRNDPYNLADTSGGDHTKEEPLSDSLLSKTWAFDF
jgi:hypothetical protein